MLDCAEPVLGPERAAWQYPVRSIIEQGGRVCFGSDWFVAPLDPLYGIEAAVTHTLPASLPLHSAHSESDGGDESRYRQPWNASQCISVEEAIKFYTLNSAWMSFCESESGSLEVGKSADIVILSQNILDIEPSRIHATSVLVTIADGKIVYRHPRLRLESLIRPGASGS